MHIFKVTVFIKQAECELNTVLRGGV